MGVQVDMDFGIDCEAVGKGLLCWQKGYFPARNWLENMRGSIIIRQQFHRNQLVIIVKYVNLLHV